MIVFLLGPGIFLGAFAVSFLKFSSFFLEGQVRPVPIRTTGSQIDTLISAIVSGGVVGRAMGKKHISARFACFTPSPVHHVI